jgi:hypothetical protein
LSVATLPATMSGLNACTPARLNRPSTLRSHGRLSASENVPEAERLVSLATKRAEPMQTVRPSARKRTGRHCGVRNPRRSFRAVPGDGDGQMSFKVTSISNGRRRARAVEVDASAKGAHEGHVPPTHERDAVR